MKSDYTHVVLILDASTSMTEITPATLEGMEKLIRDQKEAEGTCTMSIYIFNNNYTEVYDMVNVERCEEIIKKVKKEYKPDGYTALLYTMIEVIDKTGRTLARMPEDERPSKVLVVTVTDGLENHSQYHEKILEKGLETTAQTNVAAAIGTIRQPIFGMLRTTLYREPEYSVTKLQERITHQTDKYNWTFVYTGANHDSFSVGGAMGYGTSNTANYVATHDGVTDNMQKISKGLLRSRKMDNVAYASTGKHSFFAEEDEPK